ncbi:hypothetical protein SUGI_0451060, partial [Cryptomeria japonica]
MCLNFSVNQNQVNADTFAADLPNFSESAFSMFIGCTIGKLHVTTVQFFVGLRLEVEQLQQYFILNIPCLIF